MTGPDDVINSAERICVMAADRDALRDRIAARAQRPRHRNNRLLLWRRRLRHPIRWLGAQHQPLWDLDLKGPHR